LLAQVKQLEEDNRTLRDNLGFFEKLIPSVGGDGVAIRGLQADLVEPNSLKWQVLVIQASKNAPEFSGRLDVTFSGTMAGKPWTMSLPQGPVSIKIRQYGRMEGTLELPAQVVVKGVTARVLDGSSVRATQTIKL
jgi:hypothetical protein